MRDAWGQPAALLSGRAHPESVRAAEALRRRAEAWMRASGAARVWVTPIGTGLSGGQHQAGTARMGHDPATSVTDPFGRVHGHPNLWVCDAALHVTNGGVNPVLTVLALAYRVAEELVRSTDLERRRSGAATHLIRRSSRTFSGVAIGRCARRRGVDSAYGTEDR